MIHNSLDSESCIPDRQANHDSADRLNIIMDDTCVWNGILSKLTGKYVIYAQQIYIVIEYLLSLFDW